MQYQASTFRRLAVALAALATMAVLIALPDVSSAAPAAPAGDTDPAGGSAAMPHTDFNGDGKADVFWYAPGAGPDSIWQATGAGFTHHPKPVSGTYTPITGDFDGDGRSDIFWYAPGAAPDSIWYSKGTASFVHKPVPVTGHYRPFVGDFDGDGRSDIFWYGPGGAPDTIWLSTPTGFTGHPTPVSGDYVPLVGDFNGDGRSDIFWYGPGAVSDSIWLSTGPATFAKHAKPVGGTYDPFVGDFNGDGRSDIFWYGARSLPDVIWQGTSSGTTFTPKATKVSGWYLPIPGDYDGNGRTDVMWYSPGPGVDSMWMATATDFVSRAVNVTGRYLPVGTRGLQPDPEAVVPVAPGASGAAVVRLQSKLRELNFFIPRVDGRYDAITSQAVMAFQKHHGLGRDGVVGPATAARINTASPAQALRGGNHVEVSIARQTLIVVRNGRTLVFNTSTGSPGWDTPRGNFVMSRQINGMRYAPLGQLWRPKYFNGGIAMHGSPSIPAYPASHGCTRLHNEAINYIWDAGLVPIGTPVWVH